MGALFAYQFRGRGPFVQKADTRSLTINIYQTTMRHLERIDPRRRVPYRYIHICIRVDVRNINFTHNRSRYTGQLRRARQP